MEGFLGPGPRAWSLVKLSQRQGLKQRPTQASSGGAAEIQGVLRGGGSVPGSDTCLRVPDDNWTCGSPLLGPTDKASGLGYCCPALTSPRLLSSHPRASDSFELPTSGGENPNHALETAEAGNG